MGNDNGGSATTARPFISPVVPSSSPSTSARKRKAPKRKAKQPAPRTPKGKKTRADPYASTSTEELPDYESSADEEPEYYVSSDYEEREDSVG